MLNGFLKKTYELRTGEMRMWLVPHVETILVQSTITLILKLSIYQEAKIESSQFHNIHTQNIRNLREDVAGAPWESPTTSKTHPLPDMVHA